MNNPSFDLMRILGIVFVDNKAILYKEVIKDAEGEYHSFYDPGLRYKDGAEVCVTNNRNKELYLSTPKFWDTGQTLIACKIKEKDLIRVEEDGTVVVKRFYVIKEIKKPKRET